ncbi:SLAP domain-containing protein [Lactobacillus kitasatonis]|uniref:Agregation promoting protein n=1 Tax=Lactobacillus kitasatonis DSM 16761 = JCM 1039 TaxID=1423767 RepID=A0A0R1VIB6_9LACO|nr:SLAP domain-containing protein [Lactobacillus kitasatonis]KRM05170.1 agregation promoting protein [Lactobacillus kitasatonis DSM 16761 = JCM 1039]
MKIKSILVKSIAVAAMSVTGLVAANNVTSNTAQAAIVQNDASVVTVNYVSNNAINVYNNYENPVATGQTLASNTSWKVIKTAYDSKGHKWYDLGKNQWVRAKYVTIGYHAAAAQTQAQTTTNTAAQTSVQSQQTQTQTTSNTSASSYTSSATGSEASAKAWIASRESGGSYSASNGQYVGKYQLSASYLNGDYSAANQERVADNYVKSRYGSWSAAKSFWQANGWY